MIIYRKGATLRIRRTPTPEPPFWAATTLAPYSARRGAPVSIDYVALRASYAERLEVTVCENVRDELERSMLRQPLHDPVLVEATELAELVFRRGDEALGVCEEVRCGATHLISTRGALPSRAHESATIAIAAWPLDFPRLETLFSEARSRELRWGVAVPVIYPVTTNAQAIAQLAEMARGASAAFFAAVPVELDATAKHAIAESLTLHGESETYTTLFHADLAPLHLEAERTIAGTAAAHGMADFIVPPRWERKSNWNAAVLLKLCAARMLAMEQDLDVATAIARSSGVIAMLDKPVERIAEAASLSIIEGVDATSVQMLSEWLRDGRSEFAEAVDEQWRVAE